MLAGNITQPHTSILTSYNAAGKIFILNNFFSVSSLEQVVTGEQECLSSPALYNIPVTALGQLALSMVKVNGAFVATKKSIFLLLLLDEY